MLADGRATTGFSFGGGAPAQERLLIDAVTQATHDQWSEGMDLRDADEENNQFDKTKKEDECVLTNMEKFFPELVNKLKRNLTNNVGFNCKLEVVNLINFLHAAIKIGVRKVLGKLETNKDIENCSNASLFFGCLLEEKRERKVVLPKVFRILAQRYLDEDNNDESYKETDVDSIPWKRAADSEEPHRMTGLWKCRLVSKKWNEAIEEIHRYGDAGHYWMSGDFRDDETYYLFWRWGDETFDRRSDVVKFVDHFKASHYDSVVGGSSERKCPFLGRSLIIVYNAEGEWDYNYCQAYFDSLMEMLGKFGGKVSYFEFKNWWDNSSEECNVDMYQKLKGMVELLPNLKVLRVPVVARANYKEEFRSSSYSAFEDELERNPFPTLPKLKMISLSRVPGPLCNHLVNLNRHITRLEVLEADFNGNCSIFTDNLPNLKQLSVGIESIEMLEAFEKYPFKLKLQKLYLWLWNSVFVPWSRVFSAIETMCDSDSCTHLNLYMPYPWTDAEKKLVLEESLELRLSFAKIERFHMQQFGRYCLDFLLPSKSSLKEISLRCDPSYVDTHQDKLRDKQVIKFFGYEDKMQESNIAKELPHLKNVKVHLYWQRFIEYLVEPCGVLKVGEESDK